MNTLQLDTSNIKQGMVFKNYKELCFMLGLDVKNGKSKTIQMREIERYMDLLKTENGNSYIVLDVYDKPLPNNVKSKYTYLIQDILLSYLAKENEHVVYINKNDLIKILGLANDKYIEYKKDKGKLLNIADEYNISEFYKRCDAKILSILESALKSLQKRVLLDYSDAYKIYYLNIHGGYDYKIADLEEHRYILDVKKRVLEEMGLKSEYQVYLNNYYKDRYYKRINEIVEDEMCWEGVFQCYQIIYNQHWIVKALSDERYRLNSEVRRAIDTQAEKRDELNLTLQKILSETLIELKGVDECQNLDIR